MLELFFIFILGVVGSFIGSIAAGAGLITLPGLLLLGIPPHLAIGSNRLGAMGFKFGSLIKYLNKGLMVKEYVIPWSIMGIVGSAIGARILVEIDPDILSKIIGLILIFLLPFVFLKKEIGIVQKKITKLRKNISHVIYFLLKIWSGFFSPGAGFFSTYLSLNGYGLTILQAKGTSRIPGLLSALSGLIVFMYAGIVDYKVGLSLFIGMFIGGYMGAHVAIKKGNEWIKPILALFIIVASIKLIFF